MSLAQSRRARLFAALALTVALLVGALPGSSPTASATTSATPVLERGDRGPAVAKLQNLLGVKATGYFGDVTRTAVIRVQQRHDLVKQDGVARTRVWQILLAARASRDSNRNSPFACPAGKPHRIYNDFGAPRSGGRSHQGNDITGPLNTPLYAVEAGTIVKAYTARLGGISIILRGKSGHEWFYTHNNKNLVRTGQSVTKGQKIALMGSTGNAGSTVHLHFEWWKNGGSAVNPNAMLRAACG